MPNQIWPFPMAVPLSSTSPSELPAGAAEVAQFGNPAAAPPGLPSATSVAPAWLPRAASTAGNDALSTAVNAALRSALGIFRVISMMAPSVIEPGRSFAHAVCRRYCKESFDVHYFDVHYKA